MMKKIAVLLVFVLIFGCTVKENLKIGCCHPVNASIQKICVLEGESTKGIEIGETHGCNDTEKTCNVTVLLNGTVLNKTVNGKKVDWMTINYCSEEELRCIQPECKAQVCGPFQYEPPSVMSYGDSIDIQEDARKGDASKIPIDEDFELKSGLFGSSCMMLNMTGDLGSVFKNTKGSSINIFRFGIGDSFKEFEDYRYLFPISDKDCNVNPILVDTQKERYMNYLPSIDEWSDTPSFREDVKSIQRVEQNNFCPTSQTAPLNSEEFGGSSELPNYQMNKVERKRIYQNGNVETLELQEFDSEFYEAALRLYYDNLLSYGLMNDEPILAPFECSLPSDCRSGECRFDKYKRGLCKLNDSTGWIECGCYSETRSCSDEVTLEAKKTRGAQQFIDFYRSGEGRSPFITFKKFAGLRRVRYDPACNIDDSKVTGVEYRWVYRSGGGGSFKSYDCCVWSSTKGKVGDKISERGEWEFTCDVFSEGGFEQGAECTYNKDPAYNNMYCDVVDWGDLTGGESISYTGAGTGVDEPLWHELWENFYTLNCPGGTIFCDKGTGVGDSNLSCDWTYNVDGVDPASDELLSAFPPDIHFFGEVKMDEAGDEYIGYTMLTQLEFRETQFYKACEPEYVVSHNFGPSWRAGAKGIVYKAISGESPLGESPLNDYLGGYIDQEVRCDSGGDTFGIYYITSAGVIERVVPVGTAGGVILLKNTGRCVMDEATAMPVSRTVGWCEPCTFTTFAKQVIKSGEPYVPSSVNTYVGTTPVSETVCEKKRTSGNEGEIFPICLKEHIETCKERIDNENWTELLDQYVDNCAMELDNTRVAGVEVLDFDPFYTCTVSFQERFVNPEYDQDWEKCINDYANYGWKSCRDRGSSFLDCSKGYYSIYRQEGAGWDGFPNSEPDSIFLQEKQMEYLAMGIQPVLDVTDESNWQRGEDLSDAIVPDGPSIVIINNVSFNDVTGKITQIKDRANEIERICPNCLISIQVNNGDPNSLYGSERVDLDKRTIEKLEGNKVLNEIDVISFSVYPQEYTSENESLCEDDLFIAEAVFDGITGFGDAMLKNEKIQKLSLVSNYWVDDAVDPECWEREMGAKSWQIESDPLYRTLGYNLQKQRSLTLSGVVGLIYSNTDKFTNQQGTEYTDHFCSIQRASKKAVESTPITLYTKIYEEEQVGCVPCELTDNYKTCTLECLNGKKCTLTAAQRASGEQYKCPDRRMPEYCALVNETVGKSWVDQEVLCTFTYPDASTETLLYTIAELDENYPDIVSSLPRGYEYRCLVDGGGSYTYYKETTAGRSTAPIILTYLNDSTQDCGVPDLTITPKLCGMELPLKNYLIQCEFLGDIQLQHGECWEDWNCEGDQICNKTTNTCEDLGPGRCRIHSGCPSGQYCDEDTMTCKPLPGGGCRVSDRECEPGELCDAGTHLCEVVECEVDADCRSEGYDYLMCTEYGFCAEPAVMDECPAEMRSLNGACVKIECDSSTPCPTGKVCTAYQKCVDEIPGECKYTIDCPPEHICVDDQCIAVDCRWNSDCEEDEMCYDFTCIEPECTSDPDCPDKLDAPPGAPGVPILYPGKCLGGLCFISVQPEPDGSMICPDGYAVDSLGYCREAECIGDADCPDDYYCANGYCRLGCRSDDECGEMEICDMRIHRCTLVECLVSEDCLAIYGEDYFCDPTNFYCREIK